MSKINIVTGNEMKELDRAAMQDYNIPGIVLMENAGIAVVREVEKIVAPLVGKKIVLLVGKGNNGGDGWVIARHLKNKGAEVQVFLLTDPDSIKGDARINFTIWQKLQGKIFSLKQEGDLSLWQQSCEQADLLIDALYGTGFTGEVRPFPRQILEIMNQVKAKVLAVDIPSGVHAATGQVGGIAVKADLTVTFALPKVGLLLYPGADYTGKVIVADISIPPELLQSPGYWLQEDLVRRFCPARARNTHKGSFGKVLVLAGSQGMLGAACLSSLACARAGAGLVTLAVPQWVQMAASVKLTEIMTRALPQTETGSVALSAWPLLQTLLEKAQVIILGPGLSVHPQTAELIRKIIQEIKIPAVIDADGLNALAGHLEILEGEHAPLILTPHQGEMARLIGQPLGDNLLEIARHYAARWQVTLVLKGASTIIAAPEHFYINSTGNPGMATGGSGDVLSGIIGGLLAQGLSPEAAAACGVWLHGRAGDWAAQSKGQMGLLAGDLIDTLPKILKSLENLSLS
ncbi:MAG: NAD(P)H-hydrate dehydratase [Clostridia bacterium]|nr:NAD(P)H-hydrate dehydratase [Clostridia bacterium]